MSTDTFMAYFDTLGFEWIVNVTDYEKKVMWASLKGETKFDLPVPRYAILRAQANPQRFPEIWLFTSDVSQKELVELSDENPQGLADLIRLHGRSIFVTPRQKDVIK